MVIKSIYVGSSLIIYIYIQGVRKIYLGVNIYNHFVVLYIDIVIYWFLDSGFLFNRYHSTKISSLFKKTTSEACAKMKHLLKEYREECIN